jgi:Holliday junction DNA helicase RuvA
VGNRLEQDALTALTALGISRQQAEQSIQKIIRAEPGITVLEDLIKKALKAI